MVQFSGGRALLPAGLALNVNFPDRLEGARSQLAEIGTYNASKVGLTTDMAASESPMMQMMQMMAKSRGAEIPALPGVSFDLNTAPPAEDQRDDESMVYRSAIAVSPMQSGFAYPSGAATMTRAQIAALLPASGG